MHRARVEATGKVRSPSVERLVDGTTMAVSATRRRRRVRVDVRCPEKAVSVSEIQRRSSMKTAVGQNAHSLNVTRSGTRNQWNSRNNGVMRSDRLAVRKPNE